ncbi:GPP34 family phosphoprotein [Streptomyces sp. NPDC051644]|uniref:GPP34 family phosphoprotein n=1 Tax=Streptomyces sp. NPDC051644 TaxID=3365666 RepID=UPI00379999E8
MTTGDELLLLAIVPGSRRIRIRAEDRLRFALRAAELADLGLAGRIAVGLRRIEVIDSRRVEDRRLSNVLHSLGATAPPPGRKDWLRRTPRSLTIEYMAGAGERFRLWPSGSA